MKFLCIGSGAVGSYLGGSLLDAGDDVLFFIKEKYLRRTKEQGLHLRLKEKNIHLFPRTTLSVEDLPELDSFDAAILAIKSYDVDEFIETILPVKDIFPPVICMLNGVENEDRLQRVLGKERTISGSLTSAVKQLDSGEIVLERLRGVGLSSKWVAVESFVEAFNKAGLNARRYQDPASMKWSKMVTNLPANSLSAILDMTPTQILADQKLYALEAAQLREAFRVMEGLKIPLIDLPGAPVSLMKFLVCNFPLLISQPFLLTAMGKGRGGKMPSFHMDLYSGKRKSEVDYLNGAIMRVGREVGVFTPVNQFLRDVLMSLVNGEIPLASYRQNPAKLVEAFKDWVKAL